MCGRLFGIVGVHYGGCCSGRCTCVCARLQWALRACTPPWGFCVVVFHGRLAERHNTSFLSFNALVVSQPGLQATDPDDIHALAEPFHTRGQPVILEETRYEYYLTPPGDSLAWFRRLFWRAALSGAHATYGGLR